MALTAIVVQYASANKKLSSILSHFLLPPKQVRYLHWNSLSLFVFELCWIYISEFIDGVSQFSVKCNKESKLRCKYATCKSADSAALWNIILALSYRIGAKAQDIQSFILIFTLNIGTTPYHTCPKIRKSLFNYLLMCLK